MFVTNDFIYNGQGHGAVAEHLAGCRFDTGLMRPYIDDKGRHCVTINTGQQDGKGRPIYRKHLVRDLVANGMVVNGPTSLRLREWAQIDTQVIKVARERLRAWTDLSSANSFGGFNAMSKLVLEHETMSDPGEALVDMDGIAEGRSDSPLFQTEGLPLPITHADFWYSQRRLAVSRNTGTPLDTTMGEAAGRRVAELVEKTLIGTVTGMTYGPATTAFPGYSRAPKVYGYTNFPPRTTYTSLTTPTGSNPSATIANVLAMIDVMSAKNFFGPFMLYVSNDWDKYLDNDYILTGGNVATQTLRQRLRNIEAIQDVRRLDWLKSATNPFTMLLVQMTADVARAINGMDITTVQWETQGGMKLHFKVMCIQVPQLRADYNGNCGILHATTS